MAVCTTCKSLAGAPSRFDVPQHLVRMSATHRTEAVSAAEQLFVCLQCSSHWSWSTTDGWILTVPPDSHSPDEMGDVRWWKRAGDTLSRLARQVGMPGTILSNEKHRTPVAGRERQSADQ